MIENKNNSKLYMVKSNGTTHLGLFRNNFIFFKGVRFYKKLCDDTMKSPTKSGLSDKIKGPCYSRKQWFKEF
ncbi:MAG: hypothetical protein C0180_03765 [Aciduliprofundum sp.]|nr:MAG: hypothetical protein C0180_03765 [Aciduliprofundum sp.]